MHFDKAYVIGSYDFAPKRLKRFFRVCNSLNLNVSLWPAKYGLNIDTNKYIKDGYLSDDFKLHMPGSLGCLLSHVTLWEFCCSSKDCNIVLILEDDVILNNDFVEQLKSIPWEDVPKDWSIIKLSYNDVFGDLISDTIIKPKLIKKRGVNAGSWCYLINTQNIYEVKKILIPYDNTISMDVLIRNNIDNLNIFFTKNNLAYHDSKRYSPRKDINTLKKSFAIRLKMRLRKLFFQ